MTAPSTSTTPRNTLLLKIGSGWAVCTLTAVPIILSRFEDRDTAVQWQQGHEERVRAAA